MIQIPICPACGEPVASQPARNWTSGYRDGIPWWHLADNTPIHTTADGMFAVPVTVDDGAPADEETTAWLAAMRDLFATDGPYSPGRLSSAVIAAEHLHSWLHTATGPFTALMALPTPTEAAFLIGHLHRTTRVRARVHAQTATYVAERARRRPATGVDDDGHGWAETRGDASAILELLEYAADLSVDSARESATAWSLARRAAAVTAPAKQQSTGTPQTEVPGQNIRSADIATDQEPADDLVQAARLEQLTYSVFGDEATFSPELTDGAARAANTLISYLANCLGPARPAAIPAPQDLARLATSLTYLTHTLAGGLRRIADSPTSHVTGPDDARNSLTRTALRDAGESLNDAANHLIDASRLAIGFAPPNTRQRPDDGDTTPPSQTPDREAD